MATVPATEFKARCLELMDRVAEGRETYVITKRGKPVAKLVPADPPRDKSIFGCMAERTEAVGDLAKPLWTDEDWNEFAKARARQWKAGASEGRRHGAFSGGKRTGQRRPGTKAKGVGRPRARRGRP